MAKKELTKISVSTQPNGYTLTIEGEEFFYFGEVDLLAGFLAHVGKGDTNEIRKTDLLHTLFSAMVGDAYSDAVTTLKKRVAMLTQQYESTIERMDKAVEYVTNAEKQIQGMRNRIESLDQSISATAECNASTKKTVETTSAKWVQLEKKVNKTVDKLTEATTIADKSKRESKSNAADEEKTAEVVDVPEETKKGRGGRRKNDEKILEDLKRRGQIK